MRKRKGCGREDLQNMKDLSLELKSEWVMEYQLIVSMTLADNVLEWRTQANSNSPSSTWVTRSQQTRANVALQA